MPAKDLYQILQTDPSATDLQIKKAYRKLALQYHPDKNPSNPFAANNFRDIQAAYEILSNPEKRKQYNYERWYATGLSKKQGGKGSNVYTILRDSRNLLDHVKKINIFRMNHDALLHHLMKILSGSHLSILQQAADSHANAEIVGNLLSSMKNLHFKYLKEPADSLFAIASEQPDLTREIANFLHERRQQHRLQTATPLIVIFITIVLCFFLFLTSRYF